MALAHGPCPHVRFDDQTRDRADLIDSGPVPAYASPYRLEFVGGECHASRATQAISYLIRGLRERGHLGTMTDGSIADGGELSYVRLSEFARRLQSVKGVRESVRLQRRKPGTVENPDDVVDELPLALRKLEGLIPSSPTARRLRHRSRSTARAELFDNAPSSRMRTSIIWYSTSTTATARSRYPRAASTKPSGSYMDETEGARSLATKAPVGQAGHQRPFPSPLGRGMGSRPGLFKKGRSVGDVSWNVLGTG